MQSAWHSVAVCKTIWYCVGVLTAHGLGSAKGKRVNFIAPVITVFLCYNLLAVAGCLLLEAGAAVVGNTVTGSRNTYLHSTTREIRQQRKLS